MKSAPLHDDAEQMLRVKAGDQAAFALLFDRFHRPILAYCAGLVGPGPRAEEVAQEVFMRVYRFRENYEATAKFSTWLWTVARNTAINHLRDHEGERKLELPADGGESDDERGIADLAISEEMTPEEWADAGQRQDRLKAAIEALPATQREALLLVAQSGMSYEDAAETMKTSVSAVKSLLVRARGTLSKKLKKEKGA